MWLVKYAVSRIVLDPTRNSLNHISPRENLTGRNLDVDKEIKHGFGDYVQVHNDVIDNSTKLRTAGAIALMSSGNLEGSWYYMLLANERIVKRTKATVLPMPDEVILHLNVLASKRKLPMLNSLYLRIVVTLYSMMMTMLKMTVLTLVMSNMKLSMKMLTQTTPMRLLKITITMITKHILNHNSICLMKITHPH